MFHDSKFQKLWKKIFIDFITFKYFDLKVRLSFYFTKSVYILYYMNLDLKYSRKANLPIVKTCVRIIKINYFLIISKIKKSGKAKKVTRVVTYLYSNKRPINLLSILVSVPVSVIAIVSTDLFAINFIHDYIPTTSIESLSVKLVGVDLVIRVTMSVIDINLSISMKSAVMRVGSLLTG